MSKQKTAAFAPMRFIFLAMLSCCGKELKQPPGFVYFDDGFRKFEHFVPFLVQAQAKVFEDPSWPNRLADVRIEVRTLPDSFLVAGQLVIGATSFSDHPLEVFTTLAIKPDMRDVVDTALGHELTHVFYCLRGDCDPDHRGDLWLKQAAVLLEYLDIVYPSVQQAR